MPSLAKRTALLPAGCLALATTVALAWDWYSALPPDELSRASYVGSQTCSQCHQTQHNLWHRSDHDRAMELATADSVLGDFDDASFTRHGLTTRFFRRDGKFMVNTEGPDGELHDYEIKYTFGVDPLQQYMVEMPRGRVQVLRISWDTRKHEWFEVTPPDVPNERLQPGDPLHWTGIAQNWNTTCADCHSTNVRKNYDAATDTYHTTFDEISVGCEECHGPGSLHTQLAESWSLFWDRNVGYGLADLKSADPTAELAVCAKCHSRRHQVHEEFRPGNRLLDHYEPVLLQAGLYHDDGQILDEVYEYTSFLQSKMHAERVRCSDCHEPHSLKLRLPGNRLCLQCHVAGKYDGPVHHHHPPGSSGAQCIECHMPVRTYMVIDDRRDHSFRVPRPDLSVKLGTPNACTDCHTGVLETNEWAAETVRRWYGEQRPDDPHWAPAVAAGRKNEPEGETLLAEVLRRRETPAVVRATAVALLANYPGERSVALRRQALADSDPLVRASAVRAAGGPRPEQTQTDLIARLADPVRAVRVAAAGRLAFLPLENLDGGDRERFERALGEFRAAQELSLDHAGARLALGGLDRRFGRVDSAVEHLRAAMRLEPYLSGPRAELASLLDQLGGDAQEIRQLRLQEVELLERDSDLLPGHADIFYQLGLLRFLVGRLDESADALERACELAPRSYLFRMTLALLEERRYELTRDESHFEAALLSLSLLEEIAPSDPRAGQIRERLLASRAAGPSRATGGETGSN